MRPSSSSNAQHHERRCSQSGTSRFVLRLSQSCTAGLLCISLPAYASGTEGLGMIMIGMFAGLIAGIVVTARLKWRWWIKLLAFVPVVAICSTVFTASLAVLSEYQKRQEEAKRLTRLATMDDHPLHRLMCSGEDASLAEYLSKPTLDISREQWQHTLARCHAWGKLNSTSPGVDRPLSFSALARVLHTESSNPRLYCAALLKPVHRHHRVTQLSALLDLKLPIFCNAEDYQYPSGVVPIAGDDTFGWQEGLMGFDFKESTDSYTAWLKFIHQNGAALATVDRHGYWRLTGDMACAPPSAIRYIFEVVGVPPSVKAQSNNLDSPLSIVAKRLIGEGRCPVTHSMSLNDQADWDSVSKQLAIWRLEQSIDGQVTK
jgi:hypothetical protein